MSENHYERPGSFRTVAVGTAAVQLLGPAPERRGFTVAASTVNNLWIGTTADLAANAGLLLPKNGKPVTLCCCDLGTLVTRQWYVVGDTGADQIGLVEVFAGPGEAG